MAVLSMSRTEIDRVHVIRDVLAERIGIGEAARLMRVTPRQIFRLLGVYHTDGPPTGLQPTLKMFSPCPRRRLRCWL